MENKKQMSDHAIGLLVFSLMTGVLYKKFGPSTLYFVTHNWISLACFGAGALLLIGLFLFLRYYDRIAFKLSELMSTTKTEKSVYLGISDGRPIFMPHGLRIEHLLITGATGVGKTTSAVLPLIASDINNGHGLIIIDGKAENSFRNQVYAHAKMAGRARDFRFFSLCDIAHSHTFNPLVGDNPNKVAERVFSSFEFENPYYREVQFGIFTALLKLIEAGKCTPTFELVHKLATSITDLEEMLNVTGVSNSVRNLLTAFNTDPKRREQISGLEAYLRHFSSGETARLYTDPKPAIDLNRALSQNQICFFQLPTMMFPFLGRVTGNLVLQCLQSAISSRQISGKGDFCSVVLDDFQDYM